MVAIGSHEPCDRSRPNASAVAPAMARARITANMMSGGVSVRREVPPGNSATGCGRSWRPRTSHARNVTAIHSPAPPAQASTCAQA